MPSRDRLSACKVTDAQIITGSGEDPLPDARRRGGQRGASRKQKRPQARPLHGGSDCDEAGITRADTQESTVGREQVSARDQILPTEDDCGKACEWPFVFPAARQAIASSTNTSRARRVG